MDVDTLYERYCEAEWERLNAETPMDTQEVVYDLESAKESLEDVFYRLGQAIKEAEGFPVEDKIRSLWDDFETVQDDLVSLIARVKEVKSA